MEEAEAKEASEMERVRADEAAVKEAKAAKEKAAAEAAARKAALEAEVKLTLDKRAELERRPGELTQVHAATATAQESTATAPRDPRHHSPLTAPSPLPTRSG